MNINSCLYRRGPRGSLPNLHVTPACCFIDEKVNLRHLFPLDTTFILFLPSLPFFLLSFIFTIYFISSHPHLSNFDNPMASVGGSLNLTSPRICAPQLLIAINTIS